MFRRTVDFARSWEREIDSTIKVLESLSDESLSRSVVEGGRTLGFLAGHLTSALAQLGAGAGIDLAEPSAAAERATTAADLAAAYGQAARSMLDQVQSRWTDESLTEMAEVFGQTMPRGVILYVAILHQAHHRGQMTVLMRQAGLRVPGVYGPSKDDWIAMGQAPLA